MAKVNTSVAKTVEFSSPLEQATWETFFTNSDPVTCPITSCKILKAGCLEENLTSKLEVKEITKFFAKSTSEDDGWEETACIECKNGDSELHQKITFDGFKVK